MEEGRFKHIDRLSPTNLRVIQPTQAFRFAIHSDRFNHSDQVGELYRVAYLILSFSVASSWWIGSDGRVGSSSVASSWVYDLRFQSDEIGQLYRVAYSTFRFTRVESISRIEFGYPILGSDASSWWVVSSWLSNLCDSIASSEWYRVKESYRSRHLIFDPNRIVLRNWIDWFIRFWISVGSSWWVGSSWMFDLCDSQGSIQRVEHPILGPNQIELVSWIELDVWSLRFTRIELVSWIELVSRVPDLSSQSNRVGESDRVSESDQLGELMNRIKWVGSTWWVWWIGSSEWVDSNGWIVSA